MLRIQSCTVPLFLQKRAIRIINNAKFNGHTDPLFKSGRILKIHDLFEYQSALFTFDLLSNNLPGSFNGTFVYNRDLSTTYSTRQSDLLYVARCHSEFASKLPLFCSVEYIPPVCRGTRVTGRYFSVFTGMLVHIN